MSAQVKVGNTEKVPCEKSVSPARRDSTCLKRSATGCKEDTERVARKIEETPPKRFLRVEDIWVQADVNRRRMSLGVS